MKCQPHQLAKKFSLEDFDRKKSMYLMPILAWHSNEWLQTFEFYFAKRSLTWLV